MISDEWLNRGTWSMNEANSPNINMKYSDLFLIPAGTIREPLSTQELGS